MKVLIVSGFLGAGKTTFIKELIEKTGSRPVILENEYGENDLDSRELSKTQDLKILEFMEGCVCCTMKGKFINSVLTISAGLDPEYLIIEPTGVGKLGNILACLRKISYERIELLTPIVIVSPASMREYALHWGDIFRNQIENAGFIAFSKVENEDADSIADAVAFVREINPDVPIQAEHYSQKGDDWWRELLQMKAEQQLPIKLSPQQENFEQITVKDVAFPYPGVLVALLAGILLGRYGKVTRAKGVVRIGGEVLRFDVADGMYAIKAEEAADATSQCVFIGEDISSQALLEYMGKADKTDVSVVHTAARFKSIMARKYDKNIDFNEPSEKRKRQQSDATTVNE